MHCLCNSLEQGPCTQGASFDIVMYMNIRCDCFRAGLCKCEGDKCVKSVRRMCDDGECSYRPLLTLFIMEQLSFASRVMVSNRIQSMVMRIILRLYTLQQLSRSTCGV